MESYEVHYARLVSDVTKFMFTRANRCFRAGSGDNFLINVLIACVERSMDAHELS